MKIFVFGGRSLSSLSWAEFQRQREIRSLQGVSATVFLFGVGRLCFIQYLMELLDVKFEPLI